MFRDTQGLYEGSRTALGGIVIPNLPDGTNPAEWIMTGTKDLKMVSDYTGLNFNECLELDVITFKMLIRDSLVDKLSQDKEGRDYLEQCWVLTQTTPDINKLRNQFGGDK